MNEVELKAINTIRFLAVDAVQKANSGHPGLPMGAAAMAYSLWSRHLKHCPTCPEWPDRDRFILSAGHGSMLIYSLLHLFGYELSMEEIKNFRQWGSKTPGHPEYGDTPGVETTTGPLGQGFGNAVGMAIAERRLAEEFNRPGFTLIEHYTYALAGDGCMMEGISSEAASLAGTLGLGKLTVLYDSNRISIEGATDLAFRENVGKRFEAYGWQVLRVDDGNDTEAIRRALQAAKEDPERPAMIEVVTEIGYGSPAKQGTASAHGEPLGEENLAEARRYLGWTQQAFELPEDVRSVAAQSRAKGQQIQKEWNERLEAYFEAYPEMRAEWKRWFSRETLDEVLGDDRLWDVEKADASRGTSGEILNRLAKRLPNLIGGSADLAPSTKTLMKNRTDFSPEDPAGSNMRFGVREHAMAAVANGMTLHGGLQVYASTFFVFTDYMKPAMRLSALMGLPVTYVLTHDSIGVGEDGPTHQPIEHLMALRAVPNMVVYRPADARETALGWKVALQSRNAPVCLVLTRQKLPLLEGTGEEALKGGYVLRDAPGKRPDILLMGTGSEVSLLMDAAVALDKEGIEARVISMPSWELFEQQSLDYRNSVLPPDVTRRLAVEAGASLGWHQYIGTEGVVMALDRFGASAPGERIFQELGFTAEKVVLRAREMLK